MLACEIGGRSKREYTVLGDAVNIASRLESSVAKPMEIVIGESTYAKVAGQFAVRPLGSVALKGRQREVEAWEVIGEAVSDGTEPRAAAGPAATWVPGGEPLTSGERPTGRAIELAARPSNRLGGGSAAGSAPAADDRP